MGQIRAHLRAPWLDLERLGLGPCVQAPEESGPGSVHPQSFALGRKSGLNDSRDFFGFCRIPVVAWWKKELFLFSVNFAAPME